MSLIVVPEISGTNNVYAAPVYSGGSGTAADPYRISSRADLEALDKWIDDGGATRGVYYKVVNNIDLGGRSNPWQPIGGANTYESFQGNFNGNGYTISNMYVNESSSQKAWLDGVVGGTLHETNYGLFAVVRYSEIYNFALTGEINIDSSKVTPNISHFDNGGAIAGRFYLSGLHDVYTNVKQTFTNCAYVRGGGLVGIADGSADYYLISDCVVAGDITITNSSINCAGLAGPLHNEKHNIAITRSYISGKVTLNNCIGNFCPTIYNAELAKNYKYDYNNLYYNSESVSSAQDWEKVDSHPLSASEMKSASFANKFSNPSDWVYSSSLGALVPKAAVQPGQELFGTTEYNLTYSPNQTFTLDARTNSGYSGTQLSYSSSNDSVVKLVNANGTFQVMGAGTATITVTAPAPPSGYVAGSPLTINVTVGKGTPSWNVQRQTITKNYGDAAFASGISTTSDGKITYVSENENVVKVDDAGQITITGVGDTYVYAKAAGSNNFNASELPNYVHVTVNAVKPNPPTLEAKSGEDSRVTLTWTDPSFTGGQPIETYTIARSSDGGSSYTNIATLNAATTTTKKYVDETAQNGTTYNYVIYASNRNGGTSNASAAVTATPYREPNAPRAFTADVRADMSIELTWKAPDDDGGNAITGYLVKAFLDAEHTNQVGESVTIEADNSDIEKVYSTVFSGLSPKTRYYFTVAAVNEASGSGKEMTSATDIMTWTNPDPPTGIATKAASKNSVEVSWTAPEFTGGTPILSYIVAYKKASEAEWQYKREISETSTVIEGLEQGIEYEFKICGVNAVSEDGGEYSETAVQIPAEKPAVPKLGKLTTMNSGVMIESAENTDNCGDKVTEYHVYYREMGTVDFQGPVSYQAGTDESLKSALLRGLTNGKHYEIAVAAVNSYGESEKSAVSVMMAGLPSKPENVLAESQTGQKVRIAFDPCDGNGSLITGYDVYVSVSGGEYTQMWLPVGVTETTFDASAYLNGDSISVYVVSNNRYGTSENSEVVKTYVGAPSVPEITELITDEDAISLSWTSSFPNGNRIGKYTVYISDDEGNKTSFDTTGADVLSMNIDNTMYEFSPGIKYTATVTCTNSAGEGSPSRAKTFTFGTPEVPTVEEPVMGNESLTVKWSAPANDGGEKIIGYNIYLNNEKTPTMYVDWNEVTNEDGTVKYKIYTTDYRRGGDRTEYKEQNNLDKFEVEIDGLANGSEYLVDVRARNLNGEGPGNEDNKPVTPATTASEPNNITAEPIIISGEEAGTTAKIDWTKPYTDGGTVIENYKVSVYKTGVKNPETGEYDAVEPTTDESGKEKAAWTALIDPINGRTATATGLEAGSKYRVEIAAITAAGEGKTGTAELKTHALPGKATVTSLESGVGNDKSLPLTVSWTAPSDNGGTEITGYDICVVTDEAYFSLNTERLSPETRTLTINDTRIKNKSSYHIAVMTYNAVGGRLSDDKTIMMGSIAPPKNIEVSEGDVSGSILVEWPMEQYSAIKNSISSFSIYVSGELKATRTVSEIEEEGSVEIDFISLGTPKYVEVSVVNTGGVEGNKSEPIYITLGAPKRVTGVKAEAKENAAKVSWTPTSGEGSQKVTGYNIYVDGKLKTKVEDGTASETTVEGLEAEKEYSITVRALNKNGSGGAELEGISSEAVKVIPYAKPDTPKVTNIKPGVGEFTFEFETPNGNGADISSYKIYVDGIDIAETETVTAEISGGSPNKVKVRGVTDGVEHSFCITAVSNVKLESVKPDEMYKVVTGVPMPPEDIKIKAGVGKAEISFAGSEDVSEENPTTEYVIYQETSEGKAKLVGIPADEKDAESGRYIKVIEGLTDGVEYKYTIRARNAVDEGPESGAVSVIPGTPEAPEITSIISGNGTLTVNWLKPQENGGAITRYTVYVDGNKAEMVGVPNTSARITGLINGASYVITVSATNVAVGEGLTSEPKIGIPGTRSDMVGGIKAEAGYDNGCTIKLSWDKPTDDGGLSIDEYEVTADGVEPENILVNSAKREALITGLSEDTEYVFTITPINSAGRGTTAEYSAKTLAKPSAPTMIGAEGANRKLEVTWKAPNGERDGVEYYTIEAKPTSGGETVTKNSETNPIPNENGEYVLTLTEEDGLTVGTKYDVSVKAVNAVGEGESSASTRITVTNNTVKTRPGAPKNVTAEAGDGKVTLSWNAPDDDGNDRITSYVIYYGTSEDDMGPITESIDGYTFSYNHTGLRNNTTYYYKIKAVNGVSVDGGAFSETVSAIPSRIAPPSAPQWPELNNETGESAYETNASGNALTINWNEAIDPEGNNPVTYEINVNGEEYNVGENTSYVIENPEEGLRYNVRVKATNSRGVSSVSDFIRVYKDLNVRKGSAEEGFEYPAQYAEGIYAYIDADYDSEEDDKIVIGEPSAPQNFAVTTMEEEGLKATLKWEPPLSNGNSEIVKYNIYSTVDGAEREPIEVPVVQTAMYAAREAETGLEYNCDIDYGPAYTFEVKAVNAEGLEGAATPTKVVFKSKSTSLSTPTNFTVAVNEETKTDINIGWTTVDNATEYVLYVNGLPTTLTEGEGGYAVTDSTASYTYAGEINKEYIFMLSAKNAGSESAGTSPQTVNTNEVPAEVPQNIELALNPEQTGVTVTWSEPTNAVEADIAGYIIQVNGDTVQEEIDGVMTDKVIEGTEYTISGTGTCFVKLAAVSKHGTKGKLSETYEYIKPDNTEYELDAPPAPQSLSKNEFEKTEDGLLVTGENLTLTWVAGMSETTQLETEGYNVYINSETPLNSEPITETTYTASVEAGKTYYVQVEPVGTREGGETVVGQRATLKFAVDANNYEEPEAITDLTAQLSSDETEVTLNFTENSAYTYYLTVNGSEQNTPINNGYVYAVTSADGTNITFKVKAVRSYSDGTETSSDSNEQTVSLTKGGGGGDDPSYDMNPPIIEKYISDGVNKVKVFWKAADKLSGETGEIVKYGIKTGQKGGATSEITTVTPSGTGLESYEITFTSISEKQDIEIVAYKTIGGNDIPLATSAKKTITPFCNNVKSAADYTNADPNAEVTNPDTNMDGDVDTQEEKVTISGSASKDNIKVTLIDEFGNKISGTVTNGETTGGYTAFTATFPSSSLQGSTYSVEISRDGFTKYTLTDVPKDKLAEVTINEVTIYAGDLDKDDTVSANDLFLLSANLNTTGTALNGDLDGDGTIGANDLFLLSANLNRLSQTEAWSN